MSHQNRTKASSPNPQGLGFRGLGFRGLGFRGLGFRGLGFRGLGTLNPEPLTPKPSVRSLHSELSLSHGAKHSSSSHPSKQGLEPSVDPR